MSVISKIVASVALATAFAAATAFTAISANASTLFDVSFSGDGVSTTDAVFTTSGSGPDYLITNVMGTLEVGSTGYAMSLVLPGGFGNPDNILVYPGPPNVTVNGFTVLANGLDYNVWYQNPRCSPYCIQPSTASTGVVFDATLSVDEIGTTPLPSTWTMLIAGLVGLGFLAYCVSKKKGAALAAA